MVNRLTHTVNMNVDAMKADRVQNRTVQDRIGYDSTGYINSYKTGQDIKDSTRQDRTG